MRSPRDLEKSHVVAAAILYLFSKVTEENAFWTLVCLLEDVNFVLGAEAEVTTETIVLEERTRHNSSFELVNTNFGG